MVYTLLYIIQEQAEKLDYTSKLIYDQSRQLSHADSLIKKLELDMEDIKSLVDGMEAKITAFKKKEINKTKMTEN